MNTTRIGQKITATLAICAAIYSASFASGNEAPKPIAGWGVVVDPDGDCQIAADQGKLRISIPGKDHALATERGKTNAPRVLQEVEGDFEVTLKLSVKFPLLVSSDVTARRAFQSAGLVLWQDSGSYVRLDHAQMVIGAQTKSFASFELRRDGRFARQGSASELPLTGTNTWLRLNRRGDRVTASVSEDGKVWDALPTLKVDFSPRLQVGVTAGHNTSTPISAAFEEFKIGKLQQ